MNDTPHPSPIEHLLALSTAELVDESVKDAILATGPLAGVVVRRILSERVGLVLALQSVKQELGALSEKDYEERDEASVVLLAALNVMESQDVGAMDRGQCLDAITETANGIDAERIQGEIEKLGAECSSLRCQIIQERATIPDSINELMQILRPYIRDTETGVGCVRRILRELATSTAIIEEACRIIDPKKPPVKITEGVRDLLRELDAERSKVSALTVELELAKREKHGLAPIAAELAEGGECS